MPLKRPAPLSDAALGGGDAAAKNVFHTGRPEDVIGVLNNGMPLPVKNTFIDVPSGHTPTSMKGARMQGPPGLMTAPADLFSAPGLMQRAMQAPQAPPTPMAAIPSPASYRRAVLASNMPMATPSPTHAAAMMASLQGTLKPVASSTVPGQMLSMSTGQLCSPTSAQRDYLTYQNLVAVEPARPATLQYRPAPVPEQIEDDNDDDDGDDDSDGEIRPPPEDAPKPPPGALHPSLGSELHESQQCKRCCFFPRGRCTNGYNCEFCHYEHEKRKRKNKKKKKKGGATSAPDFPPVYATAVPSAPSSLPQMAVLAPLAPPRAAQPNQLPPNASMGVPQLVPAQMTSPGQGYPQGSPAHMYAQGYPQAFAQAFAQSFPQPSQAPPPWNANQGHYVWCDMPPGAVAGPPPAPSAPPVLAQGYVPSAPVYAPPSMGGLTLSTGPAGPPMMPVMQTMPMVATGPALSPPPAPPAPPMAIAPAPAAPLMQAPTMMPPPPGAPSVTTVTLPPGAPPPQFAQVAELVAPVAPPPPMRSPKFGSVQVADFTAPPPMQSPKFAQAGGPSMPPPMQSPKFAQADFMAPPPMQSPKLPTSISMAQSLQQASAPGAPVIARLIPTAPGGFAGG